jgi:hypothetical protein
MGMRRWLFLFGFAGILSGCDTFFQVKGNLTECGTATPIAGAEVVVTTDPGAWEGPEAEATSTDENGYFFVGLNKPMGEAATVSFSKDGFAPLSRDFPTGVPSWPYEFAPCLEPVAAGTP